MSKILVIDDESWLREMIRLALEQQGFEVIEAFDSTDGSNKARQFLPDLILCDVNMDKQGSGYTTLTKLREDAATAAIPFILMTGMADSAGMRHGMELGADDYLPKPFKVDELYAAVNARLRKVKTVRDDAERKLTSLRTHISMMMPHELRTPLNGIVANAELLVTSAATLGTATITEMGREICNSGLRLERLIENFLFYARLEMVATDADSVIALRSAKIAAPSNSLRAAAIAQAEMAGRLPDLTLELAEVPVAMAEEYFKKIVNELVQNAFKFSESGSPVQVSLKTVGEETEFAVHDAELKLGVGQDEPCQRRPISGTLVDGERHCAQFFDEHRAQPLGGFVDGEVDVVTSLFLGRRGEHRRRQRIGETETGRHRHVVDRAVLVVLAEGLTGEVATHDALERDHLRPTSQRRAPVGLGRQGDPKLGVDDRGVHGDHRVRHDVSNLLQPEGGHGGEDSALVGDGLSHHHVESRQAV